MKQAHQDAIATAKAREAALRAEAEVFRAKGSLWDAIQRVIQAEQYRNHRLAIEAKETV